MQATRGLVRPMCMCCVRLGVLFFCICVYLFVSQSSVPASRPYFFALISRLACLRVPVSELNRVFVLVLVEGLGGRVSGKEKVESKNSNHTRREKKKKGGETEPRRRLSGVTLPFFRSITQPFAFQLHFRLDSRHQFEILLYRTSIITCFTKNNFFPFDSLQEKFYDTEIFFAERNEGVEVK